MPSLPSHSANHGNRTMQIAPSARLEKSFNGTLTVISSSGRSYTSAELCICTDFCNCPTAIPLWSAWMLQISGEIYSRDSGDLKCRRCNRMRPFRFTSLSTV